MQVYVVQAVCCAGCMLSDGFFASDVSVTCLVIGLVMNDAPYCLEVERGFLVCLAFKKKNVHSVFGCVYVLNKSRS